VPSLTGIDAIAALYLLSRGRVVLARVLVAVQVFLVLLGWACAQYPMLVSPHITIQGAAAPSSVLALLDLALLLGAFILFPSLAYLYRVFKGEGAFSIIDKR
jgi:cytochrome d ubiquinol oxidase subunit II